jgi:hypothetical protein
VIERRQIADLVFERLPDFAGTSHLYSLGADPGRRPSYASCLMRLAIHAARLAACRDEASLDRVFRLVEELLEGGPTRGLHPVEIWFLEIFAGGLNELGVRWADFEALAGPKTRESVDMFRGLGLWEEFRLPGPYADLLR